VSPSLLCLLLTASPPGAAVLEQLDTIVREHFYSTERLAEVGWPALVAKARTKLARTPADQDAIFEELVAGLKTSHTEYLARDRPEYWELASIFEDFLKEAPSRCAPGEFPHVPVERESIGVLWRRVEKRWFILGVLDGGGAAKAGLHAGDEVLSAGGKPFHPITSFEGLADQPVKLTVRRAREASVAQNGGNQAQPFEREVTPTRKSPRTEFREALDASARVITSGTARVGYVRVWSWAGDEMQSALRDAIVELNHQRLTGFILDLRDGWGGASPFFVDIFDPHPPALVSRSRGAQPFGFDTQVRVPAVVLINAGSRSGKESVAYAVRKHHLATLVGANTAGAMLPGSPYCLKNHALLYLASATLTVDGEVLEGTGVAPDVAVPFEFRYADGKDPQLDKAVELLSK
jgi:carboxyl-terminal processing protease